MAKQRSEVAHEDKWNVELLYKDFLSWNEAFQKEIPEGKKPRWPELAAYRGKLGDSPETLKKVLDLLFSIDRKISNLYTYVHLRFDEDITHDEHKMGFNKVLGIAHDFQQETSWIEPEILELSESKIKDYLNSPALVEYRFHLEKIVRVKKHMLPKEQEEILALSGKALQSTQKAFSAINDADFKFGKVTDSQGKEYELTHAMYGIYTRSQDRTLRESTFKKMHGQFGGYENTLTELLNGTVQGHVFYAKAKKYESCLDASLFPKNIDTKVYHSLIKAVHDRLGAHHRYIKLRQKVLNIGPLHLYDMHVPLTKNLDIKMTYQEGEDAVIASVAALGPEYQNALRKGFKEHRWVDRYENQNKRSGAYSSGCYDSQPYILMNYKDLLRDVFVLAHEAGHSMHSLLSHQNQPYQYGDYPIFLAEVASTFNEDLLTRYLLEHAKNKEEKIFLINQKIEDIRGTLFRQTMFAEFELMIHQFAEQNIPLTPKHLKQEYRKLNQKYFGPDVIIDEVADIEWARIPHFYYNFYVYQYATGISAALALADRVVNGGIEEREAYLNFLKSGCSKYPIDILHAAGVDMRTPQPVTAAINKFETLVEELERLI
jgi:oligoendopeptidase F